MTEEEARGIAAFFDFPGYRAEPVRVPHTQRWCLRVYDDEEPGQGDYRHFHSLDAWHRYYDWGELAYTY